MNDLLGTNINLKYSKEAVRNLLVIVLVYGIQEVLRIQFFRCPCTNYALYSFILVAAPTGFLVGIGFYSSDGYWQIVSRRKHITNYKLRLNYCLKSLPSLFEPLLPAAAFIVFALMRGEYYACAKAGRRDGACGAEQGLEPNLKTTSQEIAKFNAQSQLLGCGILTGITIFAVGILFIRNCCFERDVIPGNEEFRLIENQVVFAAFRDRLKETIEKEVKRDIEEAFDGQEQRDAESVFKKARDQIYHKKSLKKGDFPDSTFMKMVIPLPELPTLAFERLVWEGGEGKTERSN